MEYDDATRLAYMIDMALEGGTHERALALFRAMDDVSLPDFAEDPEGARAEVRRAIDQVISEASYATAQGTLQ